MKTACPSATSPLLSCNSYTIKTPLSKCTVQWFPVYSPAVQPPPLSSSTRCITPQGSHVPHLLALAPQLLRPCGPVWSGLLPFVEPHAMGFGVWLPSHSAVLERCSRVHARSRLCRRRCLHFHGRVTVPRKDSLHFVYPLFIGSWIFGSFPLFWLSWIIML